jgi:hypothetical protein
MRRKIGSWETFDKVWCPPNIMRRKIGTWERFDKEWCPPTPCNLCVRDGRKQNEVVLSNIL